MAGYSETPLIGKLGIKEGFNILLMHPPAWYAPWLGSETQKINLMKPTSRVKADFIHIFETKMADFETDFLKAKDRLTINGMLWVSWPKKASKLPTDLNENLIRDYGLKNGLVDVKVCAVDEVWSGLKFVYRLKDRKQG